MTEMERTETTATPEPHPYAPHPYTPHWFLRLMRRPLLLAGGLLVPLFTFLALTIGPIGPISPILGNAAFAAENPTVNYEKRWEEREFEEVSTTCMGCHETLPRKLGKPSREHITSAHFRAVVTCNECHGGDPTTDDEEAAHSIEKGFIGKLDAKMMLDRCGTCHVQEVKLFTGSKHFPEHKEARQVTCQECHGSHDIGAGSRAPEFEWATNCKSCHDLESVPDLPPDLIAMMTQKSEVYQKMRELRLKLNNQPFPPEIMEPYREIRQLSADIVHATQAQGIGKQVAEIMSKTKAFEATLNKAVAE